MKGTMPQARVLYVVRACQSTLDDRKYRSFPLRRALHPESLRGINGYKLTKTFIITFLVIIVGVASIS